MYELSYKTERTVAEIDAQEYISRFRKGDYFEQFCRQCGNYGNRYGCPPFNYDPADIIRKYTRVRLIGVKITPVSKHLPLKIANNFMAPIINELNEELYITEQELGGMFFGFVGKCTYCGDAPCARISGEPCRHPKRVRPSLEAYGFDINKTAEELLGIKIKWSANKYLPEYLTLVCGIFF